MQQPRRDSHVKHRTNTDALHAGALNLSREVFVDLLADFDDHAAFDRVDHVIERSAPDDAVAQRFDLFAAFDNRRRARCRAAFRNPVRR